MDRLLLKKQIKTKTITAAKPCQIGKVYDYNEQNFVIILLQHILSITKQLAITEYYNKENYVYPEL